MKRIVLVFLVFCLAQVVRSQNNTFPATGNVGIGTTAPTTKLDVRGSSSGLQAQFGFGSGSNYITVGNIGAQTYQTQFGFNVATEKGFIQAIGTSTSNYRDLLLNPSGGNVGIGTTTPFAKITIPSGTGYNGMFGIEAASVADSRRWWIHTDYQVYGDFSISTETTKQQGVNPNLSRLYINNNGNVGIGTTTPSRKLDIRGVDDGNAQIRVSGTIAPQYFWEFGEESAVSGDFFIDHQGTTGLLHVLRIKESNGNVGIGATTPQGRLDLGDGTGGHSIVWGGSSGTSHYASIGTMYSSANLVSGVGIKLSPNSNSLLYSYTGTIGVAGILQDLSGDTYFFNQTYGSKTKDAAFDWSANSKMVIKSSGNVGIGTTTPGFALDINKPGNNTSIHLSKTDAPTASWYLHSGRLNSGEFSIGNDNNYVLAILPNGNVGVGTTSPAAPLHVFSPSGDVAYFQSGTGSTNFKITQEILNYRHGMKIGTVGASEDLRFTAGSTDAKMVLLHTTGYVGIGTTNPQNLLDVAGTIRCTEVKVVALPWADFVFHPSYKLRTLGEVEQFIKTNNHLPEIPTTAEVKENGIGLGEMNAKLLQKVEELTLYMIEMQKKMVDQQKQIDELKGQKGK